MNTQLVCFATVPRGLEKALASELQQLGILGPKPGLAGVAFETDLEGAYRVCLWSRLASRVLLELASFPAADPDSLYQGAADVAWPQVFDAGERFAVHCTSRRSAIDHTHFAALKIKDAIVDRFRDETGERPSVDVKQADIRIHCHIDRDVASIYLDMAGQGLHQRGYRKSGVEAPLRENLAAAILNLLDWPRLAKEGYRFMDPMCGSGTFLIEAAMMAGDIAPGLLRAQFGFEAWKGHDKVLWEHLREEAVARRAEGLKRIPPVLGRDQDPAAIRAAGENVQAAGLERQIVLEPGDISGLGHISGPGLAVMNPPYGERLKPEHGLARLYAQIGKMMSESLQGWRVGVLTSEPDLAHRFRRNPERRWSLYNGALEVKLLSYTIREHRKQPALPAEEVDTELAQPLANRINKNLKHLGRWARKNAVSAYRVYDADIPEFALAIDLYQADELHAVVYEYRPPATVAAELAEARLAAAMAILPETLGIPETQIHLKERARQKGEAQYERMDHQLRFYEIQEGACRLLVNFTDYLDTGLFLDHRLTRAMIGEQSSGKSFLNLFCYTGAATIHAALGGAERTTSVDLSATYLDWARRNMELNAVQEGPRHRLIQADCIAWLEDHAKDLGAEKYDLIFLDPPTFSNSKRMQGVLDINRDYPQLIRWAARLLAKGGELIFSTNSRKFRMDTEQFKGLKIEDISRATLPQDFERNPRIHYCWRITKSSTTIYLNRNKDEGT